MRTAVLIKQVPVSNQVSVDPVTHALVRASSEGMVNPADLNAVEAALRLKEETGGSVTVFTMGPPDAEQSLREALARGCDEACLITDRAFGGADTVATARVLAESIRRYGEFDLILCGAQSADGATGQVGAMTAEYLDIPHVCEVCGISLWPEQEPEQTGKTSGAETGNGMFRFLYALKKYGGKLCTIECSLPCLLTVSFGANEPRLSTLRSKRAAKSKPVAVYDNRTLGFAPEETGLLGSPTAVTDSFSPEGGRRAIMIEGSPKELAEKLAELLSEAEERLGLAEKTGT